MKYMKITQENLYVDVGAQMGKENIDYINKSSLLYKVG